MIKRKTNLISIISIFMLFLFAVASINFFNFSSWVSKAEVTPQTNENFYISVYGRDRNLLMTEDEDYFNGTTAYIYQWEDTSKFVLNIDPTKNIPLKNHVNGVETYVLSIEIEYLQGYYKNAAWTRYNTVLLYTDTQQGENSYLNFTSVKPEFNIDEGITGSDLSSGLEVNISTWGIYRFRMVINSQDTYSDYFVVEPKTNILESPKITHKVTPSKVTLHSAYSFTLKNAEKYKYIDKSKLVWYALGQSEDGTSYSLTFSDINSGKKDFLTCSSALYETWSRTGQTFYFDDNGIAGVWKIWCEYYYGNDNLTFLKSNVQTIKSGNDIQFSVVIWIVLGVAVLCMGVTIGICIYKNKREKVY